MSYYGYEEGLYSLAHHGIVGMKWKNRRNRRLMYAASAGGDKKIKSRKVSYTNDEMKQHAMEQREQAMNDAKKKKRREDEMMRKRKIRYRTLLRQL